MQERGLLFEAGYTPFPFYLFPTKRKASSGNQVESGSKEFPFYLFPTKRKAKRVTPRLG